MKTFPDPAKVDPRVLDYAATKLQAGYRGWKTRQDLKKGKL